MQSIDRHFLPGGLGEVDVRQATLFGDIGHCGRVFGQNFTVLWIRQIGKTLRRHEASWRKEDDARRMTPELIE